MSGWRALVEQIGDEVVVPGASTVHRLRQAMPLRYTNAGRTLCKHELRKHGRNARMYLNAIPPSKYFDNSPKQKQTRALLSLFKHSKSASPRELGPASKATATSTATVQRSTSRPATTKRQFIKYRINRGKSLSATVVLKASRRRYRTDTHTLNTSLLASQPWPYPIYSLLNILLQFLKYYGTSFECFRQYFIAKKLFAR
ncbi:hypothetical protein CBL_04617 [Carabus blaptoides fortunei]